MKLNNILNEKYKNKLENPNLEQDFCLVTARGIYNIGHDSTRIITWLAYYDKSFYENVTYFALMGSILNYLKKSF